MNSSNRKRAGVAKLPRHTLAGTVAALVLLPFMVFAKNWPEADFAHAPVVPYALPNPHDALIGAPIAYTIEKGDTLLDIGRWYGLSGTEISDANGKLDWWTPPAGRQIILPTQRILPEGPRVGIVMNIPEMRIYYYYPSPVVGHHRSARLRTAAWHGATPRVVYTFPVGLGRYDWRTPIANFTVTGKLVNPTWVVPQDIYEEHLERDGEADHVIPGGDPDNPLGHYKLNLSLPEYGIHGTDVPWGVGMNVSHGCIRLYPEGIERLFHLVPVGTPGRFVYQPIKFGWRGNDLYVEVHDDLYGLYPGLWNHALHEVKRLHLENSVDPAKLEKAVEARSGLATYVMNGPGPMENVEPATTAFIPPPPGLTATMDPASAGSASADRAIAPAAADSDDALGAGALDSADQPPPGGKAPDIAGPAESAPESAPPRPASHAVNDPSIE